VAIVQTLDDLLERVDRLLPHAAGAQHRSLLAVRSKAKKAAKQIAAAFRA